MGARLCACGCRRSLEGRSERTIYFDHRCSQRAYRKRLREAAEAAGVPARLSLETVRAAKSTLDHNGDAHARPRARQKRSRTGLSIYLPTPERAEALAAALEQLAADRPELDMTLEREAIRRALERRRRRH